MAFRNGKGGSSASLPHSEPTSAAPRKSNRNDEQRSAPPPSRKTPEKKNRSQWTPERTPQGQRDKSPCDRTGSKSSFESVDLPPLEDDEENINPTPKPTKQDRIHNSETKRYRRHPESPKTDEPTTARDVYVEMGDEDRETPKPRSSRPARQDDLPPVREATPQRADRPLSRGNSDLNRHRVVPPIKQEDDQSRHSTPNQSRNNTPDDRNSRRNTPDDRNSRRNTPDDRNSRRNTPDDRNRRGTPDDRNRRGTPDDTNSSNHTQDDNRSGDRHSASDRRQSSRPQSNESEAQRNSSPEQRNSERNTPGSDDARATVLSPRERNESPRRQIPVQNPRESSASSRNDPVSQDEPGDSNRGNPNNEVNDEARSDDNEDESPPESPEPEVPRRTPKVREEDGRIAALDRLADYNLKTLAGQEAGDAPEIDDKIMKEVFSPEFQKELDNFLKT